MVSDRYFSSYEGLAREVRTEYGKFPDLVVYPSDESRGNICFRYKDELVAIWDPRSGKGVILAPE